MQETQVQSLGWEDPLEKGMATHSRILAWRIHMDWGAWQVTVPGITKCQTQLNDFHFTSTQPSCCKWFSGLDLDVLSMLAASCWYNIHYSPLLSLFDCCQLHWSTWLWNVIQWEISSTKLCKPLLTPSISHRTFFIHCTNLFVCVLRLHFYLSWYNKA